MPQFESEQMLTFRLTAEQTRRLSVFLGDRLLKEAVDIFLAINEQVAQQVGQQAPARPPGNGQAREGYAGETQKEVG